MSVKTIFTKTSQSVADTQQIAKQIARHLSVSCCVYFDAPMGAGKTTLSQSIVRALGSDEVVTSPTYSLIHQYPVSQGTIYHLDLYRIDDTEELAFLGVEDVEFASSIWLIEWPMQSPYLPTPTHYIRIKKQGEHQREICLQEMK